MELYTFHQLNFEFFCYYLLFALYYQFQDSTHCRTLAYVIVSNIYYTYIYIHLSHPPLTYTCHIHIHMYNSPVTFTCHIHLSHPPVTFTCHMHMLHVPVTSICTIHLSHLPVTSTCHIHIHLSQSPVTFTCHMHMSICHLIPNKNTLYTYK